MGLRIFMQIPIKSTNASYSVSSIPKNGETSDKEVDNAFVASCPQPARSGQRIGLMQAGSSWAGLLTRVLIRSATRCSLEQACSSGFSLTGSLIR